MVVFSILGLCFFKHVDDNRRVVEDWWDALVAENLIAQWFWAWYLYRKGFHFKLKGRGYCEKSDWNSKSSVFKTGSAFSFSGLVMSFFLCFLEVFFFAFLAVFVFLLFFFAFFFLKKKGVLQNTAHSCWILKMMSLISSQGGTGFLFAVHKVLKPYKYLIFISATYM